MRREALTNIVLSYLKPCAHVDPRIADVCQRIVGRISSATNVFDKSGKREAAAASLPRQAVSPTLAGPRPACCSPPSRTAPTATGETLQATSKRRVPIHVEIIGAQLQKQRSTPDPYVVVEIPGKPAMSFTTTVKSKTVQPEWREYRDFQDYCFDDSLLFHVYDGDPSRSNVFGRTSLRTELFFPGGFEGSLPLAHNETPTGNSLRVRVQLLGAGGPPVVTQDPCVTAALAPAPRMPSAPLKSAISPSQKCPAPTSRSKGPAAVVIAALSKWSYSARNMNGSYELTRKEINRRPVWKHSQKECYLLYLNDGTWGFKDLASGDPAEECWAYCEDTAVLPYQVRKPWYVIQDENTDDDFIPDPQGRVDAR